VKPAVDWSRYQKCDSCGAGAGAPCLVLSGYVAGQGQAVAMLADRPHGGRKLRKAVGRG
jgi:hypothetical protein